jgi:hypothetical protein
MHRRPVAVWQLGCNGSDYFSALFLGDLSVDVYEDSVSYARKSSGAAHKAGSPTILSLAAC